MEFVTIAVYWETVLGLTCLIFALAFLLHDEYKARKRLQIEHREEKERSAALAYILLENGLADELKLINDYFGW